MLSEKMVNRGAVRGSPKAAPSTSCPSTASTSGRNARRCAVLPGRGQRAQQVVTLALPDGSRAASGAGLDSVHQDLLSKIQERRRNQELLLEKLNQLAAQTATIKIDVPAPPSPIREPPPAFLEPEPPRPQPIMDAPTVAPPPPQPRVQAPAPQAPVVQRYATPAAQPPPKQQRPQPKAPPAAPPAPAAPEPLAGPNVMKVVMVGSECAPWSKTGGLGDVMSALPKAMAKRGHRVMVVVPRYADYEGVVDTGVRRQFRMFNASQEVGYYHSYIDGVDYVFLDHSSFRRGNDLYGGDRLQLMFRCALLSKAALEAVWHVPCGGIAYGDDNCVFIANDWHTALLPVFLQAHYRDYGQMTYARAIFVIHNIAHQGRGPYDEIHNLEFSDAYKEKFRLFDPMFHCEHMNILKVGLEAAHRVVAVSPGYAWECQTQEGGWGLDGTLKEHAWKLKGIVNGMDYQEWSPVGDVHLQRDGYMNYSIDTLVEGKAACKAALQKELGLPQNPNAPMLGFIGRLDYQKGVDLIRDSYDWLMSEGVQLVFLGSGTQELEQALRDMENKNKSQCRSWVGFSVKMAHRITAGVDLLLMPSRFEPCGLNQLYAMAYGTVPIVHAVGGLRDTVKPYNPFENSGTGWTFDRAEANKLRETIVNALGTYRQYRPSFQALQRRGMEQDLSWDNAAQQYEEVLVAAKYQW